MSFIIKSYDSLIEKTISRISNNIFYDKNYKPYTEDFLFKILKYLEKREKYEDCATIKKFIEDRFNHEYNYKYKIEMEQNYVNELSPILDLSPQFLNELNDFFINSNLSKEDRAKLVKIIKKNK